MEQRLLVASKGDQASVLQQGLPRIISDDAMDHATSASIGARRLPTAFEAAMPVP